MSEHTHTFNLGACQCTVLTDGVKKPDIESMPDRFPSVPKETLVSALKERHPGSETIDWSMNCLFLRTPEHNVLIDTGLGPKNGQLIPRLQDITSRSAVDAVIITHCHPDHIGGLVREEGELTFPNADYFMWDEEWDHWMGTDGVVHRAEEEYASLLRRALLPIKEHLTLINSEHTLLPGIRPVAAPGHTPGHIGLLIESENQSLLYLSDTLHAKIQLQHPNWSPRFDTDGTLAAQTRQQLLSRAADEDLLTLVYHFGFPGLGKVKRKDDAFSWQAWKKDA